MKTITAATVFASLMTTAFFAGAAAVSGPSTTKVVALESVTITAKRPSAVETPAAVKTLEPVVITASR